MKFRSPCPQGCDNQFFYTSSYRIAHQHPDIFRSHVPNTCLAATCAAVSVWVCLHYKCIWHHLLNRSTVYWIVMWGTVLERGSQNSRRRCMCQYTMLCFRWLKKHWGTLTMALVLMTSLPTGHEKAGRLSLRTFYVMFWQIFRATLQQIDTSIERHDHLQISLDWRSSTTSILLYCIFLFLL